MCNCQNIAIFVFKDQSTTFINLTLKSELIQMNRKIQLNVLIGLFFIIFLCSAINNANGPGGGYTNAPSESSCVSCHGGSLITTGTQLNSLRFKGNFTGSGYIPDSTYNLEVTFKQSGRSKFGFQITALNAANEPIGTFTNTNNRTSRVTSSINSKTREYIQHTSTGTASFGTDSTRWMFDWKAPNSNVGKITFYVVVMATDNNNQNNSGDLVYAKTFEVNPSNLLPKATASTNTTPLCNNSDIQLNGAGTNSTNSYSWRIVNGSPTTSNVQNPIVTWGTSGQRIAILTVRNSKGISIPDTLRLSLSSSPNVSITNGSSANLCNGDSIILQANAIANTTYSWTPNVSTGRTKIVKDSGTFRVKATITTTGCSSTSAPFRVNLNRNASGVLSNKSNDTNYCDFINDSFFVTGQNIDSVYWYVNGTLYSKTKGDRERISSNQNCTVQARLKSVDGCLSGFVNTLNLKISLNQSLFGLSIQKTTSSAIITLRKNSFITKYSFVIFPIIMNVASQTDTSLHLTNLNPNTWYSIRVLITQNTVCSLNQETIDFRTNDCSDLSYTTNFKNRVCKGDSIQFNINKLFNSRYSISFNNSNYSTDTIYKIKALTSDSIKLSIIDSTKLNCPPIEETLHYTVDTIDNEGVGTAKNLSICNNEYTLSAPSIYQNYQFFKNGSLISSGTSSSYKYSNLVNGDQLVLTVSNQSCQKTYAPIIVKTFDLPNADFTVEKNWFNYTFEAEEKSLNKYEWQVDTSKTIGNATLVKSLLAYSGKSLVVQLKTQNSTGCIDSNTQNLTVPDFSKISNNLKSKINVNPNPFSNQLSFTNLSKNTKIEIFNIHGQLVFDGSLVTDNQLEINTTNWKSGIYLVKVSEQNELVYIKLIKQ